MKGCILKTLALLWACPVFCQPLQRFELIITEIMADPLPVVGLPAAEFIEVKNISNRSLRLDGCRISDGVSTGVIGTGVVLPPDSLLILCSKSYATAFAEFGRTQALGTFPSIDNDGDEITIFASDGMVIHAFRFVAGDYRNPLKQAGGWSLEMIDTRFPCHGADNWAASQALQGGTPGRVNSVAGTRSDITAPRALRTWALDSVSIIVQFDEGLDSISAASLSSYHLGAAAPKIVKARPISPFFDQVLLTLTSPMDHARVYMLEVSGIRDCHGNAMVRPSSVKTGRPTLANSGQLRINEILFDPKPGGADYIELIHLGPGLIDGSGIHIGNVNSSGQVANLRPLQKQAKLIFPGDHIVCTTDPEAVLRDYFVKERDWLWKMDNLPSYPDDMGSVVLMDMTGNELDRFEYRADMHFPLIGEKEGVALERVQPSRPTQDAGNWHSASSRSGYGTPTGRNSQFMASDTLPGEIWLSSKVLSPDLDGQDDALIITWRFPTPGNTLSMRILDIQGRLIMLLMRNSLAGTTGTISWNGLNERQLALAGGPYLLWTEVTGLNGRSRLWRIPFLISYR